MMKKSLSIPEKWSIKEVIVVCKFLEEIQNKICQQYQQLIGYICDHNQSSLSNNRMLLIAATSISMNCPINDDNTSNDLPF